MFLYVVKGIKIKITAKFRDTEHLRFEDIKRIMSPEKFPVFRETGPKIWGTNKEYYGTFRIGQWRRQYERAENLGLTLWFLHTNVSRLTMSYLFGDKHSCNECGRNYCHALNCKP